MSRDHVLCVVYTTVEAQILANCFDRLSPILAQQQLDVEVLAAVDFDHLSELGFGGERFYEYRTQ